MKVLFTPEIQVWFGELETILYEKGYFSFKESSREYVHELLHDIRDTLPTRLHRPAPMHFDPDGRGVYYATFRHSHATTWYAFFTRYAAAGETVFLVRRIENNHTAAQYF